jgi:hypothetical protein
MLSFVRGFEDVKVLANPVGYLELEMFKQRDGSLSLMAHSPIEMQSRARMPSPCPPLASSQIEQ